MTAASRETLFCSPTTTHFLDRIGWFDYVTQQIPIRLSVSLAGLLYRAGRSLLHRGFSMECRWGGPTQFRIRI